VGHRALDVVVNGREIRPERADGLVGTVCLQGAAATGKRRQAAGALTELTMTRRAALSEKRIALLHGAAPRRQPASVGPYIGIPGRNFRRQSLPSQPHLPR